MATRDPSELAPLEESSYEEVLRRRYGCFGWRQERPLRLADGRVVTTYHLARDIMLPPGSPIHSPVAAEVVRASILRAYAVVELIDRRGRLWRLMHLDRHQLRVSAGEWIASGSLIGYTSFERLPRSSSHLHLELWTSPGVRQRALQRQRRGVARLGRSARIERAALDPFAALGARGLNLLLGMRPLRSVPGACRAALGQEDDDPGAPGAPRSANRG